MSERKLIRLPDLSDSQSPQPLPQQAQVHLAYLALRTLVLSCLIVLSADLPFFTDLASTNQAGGMQENISGAISFLRAPVVQKLFD